LAEPVKILVYGYGNPGRQDDGLGIQLVKELEEWSAGSVEKHVVFETNYQLNIEDAETIRNFDLVIFADASMEELDSPVTLTRLDGINELSFTTHAASPGYVVHLCNKLFGAHPRSYLLHIRGYEWDFREGLTAQAGANLHLALEMMKSYINDPSVLLNERLPLETKP
jgi:hydrogenase maturation protease